MKKRLWKKIDEKHAQAIVGGMTKSDLVSTFSAKTKVPKLTLAFMESLTIYG